MTINTSEFLGHLNGEKNYLIILKPENLQKDINSLLDFLVIKRQWNCIYFDVQKKKKEKRKEKENFFP